METIYRTADGHEFHDIEEAYKHESALSDDDTQRIKDNLAIHLANKSKIKASFLKQDEKELNAAWKRWLNTLPKSRYELTERWAKEIYDALYRLDMACGKYRNHMNILKLAREMIPRLNQAIKLGKEHYDDEILIPPREAHHW